MQSNSVHIERERMCVCVEYIHVMLILLVSQWLQAVSWRLHRLGARDPHFPTFSAPLASSASWHHSTVPKMARGHRESLWKSPTCWTGAWDWTWLWYITVMLTHLYLYVYIYIYVYIYVQLLLWLWSFRLSWSYKCRSPTELQGFWMFSLFFVSRFGCMQTHALVSCNTWEFHRTWCWSCLDVDVCWRPHFDMWPSHASFALRVSPVSWSLGWGDWGVGVANDVHDLASNSTLAIRIDATLLIFASTLAIRIDATSLTYTARLCRSWSPLVNLFAMRRDFLRHRWE